MAERNAPAEQPDDDDRLLQAMIAETEDEIFSEATGKDQDENDGDKSLEEADDDFAGGDTDEIEEEPAEDEEVDGEEAEAAPQRDERQERFVPSGRLREEADARRAAEAQANELRTRLAVLEALQQQQRQNPAPQETRPAEPDMFVDPDGWKRHMAEQLEQRLERKYQERTVNASMEAAREEHGAEFQYAYDQLVAGKNDPIVQRDAQAILASANPGRALMKWAEPKLEAFREQRDEQARALLAERYGVDPDTLDRAMSIAMKANGGRSSQNYPQRPRANVPSLNSAVGGSRRPVNDGIGGGSSESDIFASAFTDRR